jgi:hypothetical protein
MFGNSLLGTFHHQLIGKVTFTDKQNGLCATITMGSENKKPKDFFRGQIT